MSEARELAWQGLWNNNPALVQLLGLCPLLAVTNSAINGLGLGLATLFVLACSNVTVSIIRNWIPSEIRIPVFVMIIAAFVTSVELLMHAYAYGIYQNLGIFIPLIVTNCVIIGRAEAYASKHSAPLALFDGLMMGLGFCLILLVLGGMRELLGHGTLFAGADLLFGDIARNWQLTLFEMHTSFLLAVLAPGAFIGLGLLIALKNWMDERLKARQLTPAVTIERARVTGQSNG